EDCLYDSIQPVFSRNNQDVTAAVSSEFQFLDPSIPLHDKMNVRIKPNAPIAEDQKGKIIIRRVDKKGTSYRNAEWQKGWLAAAFNEFGSFQAVVDNVPPTVNELGLGDTVDLSPSKSIIFYPKDNSAIKSFRAELDGRWLRFTNDKGSAWIYNFDERCPFGVHQLKITIEDIAGNVTTKQWWFKRYAYTLPKAQKKPGKKRTTNGKKKVGTKKK
ncbi:MAG TPA: M23 family peptidase, partial [Chitinophagaceae bacterium]